MFLILGFEIYIIGLFLVSHADTRSGLRSYLKLTAVLGGAVLQVAQRDLSGRTVLCLP